MRDKNRAPHEGPGREEFQAYLLGDLSEERKVEIESFLEENPMAQDALEGLKWVEKPQKVAKHIHRIRRKTQDRLNSRALQNPLPTKRTFRVRPEIQLKPFLASMAGLAAVILVLFMILWIPDREPEYITENQPIQKKSATSVSPQSDLEEEASSSSENKPTRPGISTSSIPQNLPNITETRQKSGSRPQKNRSIVGEADSGNMTQRREKLPYPSFIASNDFELGKDDILSSSTNLSASASVEQSPLSSQVFLPYMSNAPRDYSQQLSLRKKVYSKSLSDMAEEQASSSSLKKMDRAQTPASSVRRPMIFAPSQEERPRENVQRTFKANMGIWYFTYDMYSEAERELNLLLSSRSNHSYQTDWAASSAGWYLSRIYLATGRQGEARRLLEEISTYPNPYQGQAQIVLQKL